MSQVIRREVVAREDVGKEEYGGRGRDWRWEETTAEEILQRHGLLAVHCG